MTQPPAHIVAEKRRLPRFHITPCQFHDGGMNKNFSVQDISLGGLAIRLMDRADLGSFAVGTDHTGIVKIEGVKIACQFKVRFIRGTLIGGEWLNATRELIEHLDEISHPEVLGKSLKKYDLPEMPDTTWYHSPVGVDFLIYKMDTGTLKAVHRWVLYVHQAFVQWELNHGLSTGRAVAEDEEGYAHGIVRIETRLIDYDENPDQKLIGIARELIECTDLVDAELKNFILNHLIRI